MGEAAMATINTKDWQAVDRDTRAATYAGLMLALEVALEDGSGSPLSDEELSLLGFGVFRDPEATNGTFQLTNEDGSTAVIPLDGINYDTVSELLARLNDPRAARKSYSQPDGSTGYYMPEVPIMAQWDSVKEEGLFVPAMVVGGALGVTAAGAAGLAAPGLAVTASTFWGAASSALGWLPSTLAGSAIITTTKVGSTTAFFAGAVGILASIVDNAINPGANEAALLDAQAIAASALATPEDLAIQAQYRELGIQTPGELMAAQTPLEEQAINWSPDQPDYEAAGALSAQMWASQMPFDPAQQPAYEDDPRLRVSRDYDPASQEGEVYRYEDVGALGDNKNLRKVRYFQSSTEQIAGNMTPGMLVHFQTLAEQAMLLDPGSSRGGIPYLPGIMDSTTMWALETVLGQANQDGKTWQHTLHDMAQAGLELQAQLDEADSGPQRAPYTANPYLAPDWATLAEGAKNWVAEKLGRKANDWEVNMLGEEMKVYARQDYDAAEAANRAYYEAQGRAIDTNEEQSTGTFQDVDADARFEAFFEDKFAAELDRRDRTAQVESSTRDLMTGFDNAASIVGGR